MEIAFNSKTYKIYNNMIYYIYEIPGKKVGCTKNLKRRVEYAQKCPLGQYKVLGAANNINDASDMERDWQIKLGYKIDKMGTYKKMLKMQSKCVEKASSPETRKKAVANTDYKTMSEKRKKSILQYDLNGNFIKEWPSVKDAIKELKIDMRKCLSNKCKSAGGYKWEYKL